MARFARALVIFARNFFFASDLSPLPENGNSSAANHGSRCRRTSLQEKSCTLAARRCVGKIVSPSLRVLINVIITRSYGASGSIFPARTRRSLRSEEHTSELQSHLNLV